MRKFLALVLALVMTMSLVTVSAGAATDFTDDAKIKNAEAVEVLNAMGVLGGYADGSFRPEATLTRGAGAKLIAYLMLGQAKADKLVATYTVFEDVTDTVGLAPYIEWAAANGIVGGYGDGKFGPYDTLTQYAFGKMLLGVLGYDAKIEGYVGAGWQKNVYGDANYAGIFDGSETYAACTRDDAARMALGALKANVVAYGQSQLGGDAIYWNGILLAGGVNAWVDGRVETTRALWSFYPNLTYIPLGVDTFGRPGHKWTYGLSFEKFYMETPVAEYTVAVSECDVLQNFGLSKLSTNDIDLIHYNNGNLDEVTYADDVHDTRCATTYFGEQGDLTQLFAVAADTNNDGKDETYYFVTEIDTYLAVVNNVVKAAHRVNGDTTFDLYKDNDKAGSADNQKTTTVSAAEDMGYAKNDKLLVNMSDMVLTDNTDLPTFLRATADSYKTLVAMDRYNYTKEDGTAATLMAVVGAPTVIAAGKFTGVAADESLLTVNGVRENAAAHYELSASELNWTLNKNKSYNFLLDQYGNVIGDTDVTNAFTYGVIQGLQFEQGALNAADWADVALVNDSAVMTEVQMFQYNSAAIVEDVAGDPVATVGGVLTPEVARDDKHNTAYYDGAADGGINDYLGVVKAYELPTGGYNLVPVTNVKAAVGAFDGSVVKGNPNLTSTTGTAAVADTETVFVVKTMNDVTPVYTQYVGIDAVPSMVNVKYVAVYERDVAAEFVYVDATDGYFVGNTDIVFVTASGLSYSEVGETYSYKVYKNGALETIFVDKNAAGTPDELFGVPASKTTGVYKLTYNAQGIVTKAELMAELKNGVDYKFDGSLKGDTFSGNIGWVYSASKGISDANGTFVVEDGSLAGKAFSTTGAKIYVVKYTDGKLPASDGKWTVAGTDDVLHSVEVGTTADLDVAGAQVIYKVSATNAGVIDTVFVLAEYVD